MTISRLEAETIILFNEEEKECQVYAHSPRLKRRLRDLLQERSGDVKLACTQGDSETYIVPKTWVRIIPPRIMSEEQKAALVKRLQGREA